MNTASDIVRMNITMPKSLAEKLRKRVANHSLSGFLAEATREKLEREERERVAKILREGPPALPTINDRVTFVRELRDGNEERMNRLGV
jgi:hypothetical protein